MAKGTKNVVAVCVVPDRATGPCFDPVHPQEAGIDQRLATYRGDIALKNGGRYDNRYLGLFTIRDGQIQEFVEYFDPIPCRTPSEQSCKRTSACVES